MTDKCKCDRAGGIFPLLDCDKETRGAKEKDVYDRRFGESRWKI